MKKNRSSSPALEKQCEGVSNLPRVKKSINDVLTDAFPEGDIECQVHSSETEIVFVFISNGVCATLHVQEFNPKKVRR